MTPVSNLVLAIVAGLGLLLSLGLPWYAPSSANPNAEDGPVERAAWEVAHLFGTNVAGMVSGRDGLNGIETAMVIVVAAVVVLALVVLAVPAMRAPAEDALRVTGLAAPVVVAYAMFDRPDTGLNIHYGVFAGLAIAILMASACWHGATLRLRRTAPSVHRVSAR